jgi:hypothetical protein
MPLIHIGKPNNKIGATDPTQFIKYVMKAIAMFEDIESEDCVEGLTMKGETSLNICLYIWSPLDINANIIPLDCPRKILGITTYV